MVVDVRLKDGSAFWGGIRLLQELCMRLYVGR